MFACWSSNFIKSWYKSYRYWGTANSVITIDGNYATTDDLTKALETGGDMELIFGALDTANDSILIAYDDGADTHVGMLNYISSYFWW